MEGAICWFMGGIRCCGFMEGAICGFMGGMGGRETEMGAICILDIMTGRAVSAGVASITLGLATARPAPIRAEF
jgi:hypothetical protein